MLFPFTSWINNNSYLSMMTWDKNKSYSALHRWPQMLPIPALFLKKTFLKNWGLHQAALSAHMRPWRVTKIEKPQRGTQNPLKLSDLIVWRAAVEMLERCDDILAEAWSEDVLLRPKLVPRLSDNWVDDVQAWDFVFWFALLMQRQATFVRVF